MGGGVIILRLIKRFDFWVVALGAAVVLWALLFGARPGGTVTPGTGVDPADVDYSSYNAGTLGLNGIYGVMEQRGIKVMRWRRPLKELPAKSGRLVVWQPFQLTPDEWTDLKKWVGGGGTLVISVPGSLGTLTPGAVPGAAPARGPLPRPAGAAGQELVPAAVSPVTLGVVHLRGAGNMGFAEVPMQPEIRTYVVKTSGEPAVMGWDFKSGHVYAVADPSLLANGILPQADNLTLAVNLLDPGTGGSLVFDEYHHGASVAEDWWQTLRPQMRWTLLQALLAVLVLLTLAGVRFGQPVAATEGVSRQAVEYVFGLANLLRESRANRWVLDRLGQAFRRDLARYLGAQPGAGPEELGRLWERHTGEDGRPLSDLLTQFTRDGEPGDAQLLTIVRRMAEYRRRMASKGGTPDREHR